MAKKIRYVFGADVTELERGLKRVEYKLGKMSANAQRFGTAMTRNVTAPLVGLGALAVREAVKFESAFAKVKKSVGGTEAELKAMEQGIVEMSKTMPTAAEEIARVAASAGQLGIQRQNILGFTKAMIQLGETSNMSADEAADSLARFANITQMSQKDFDRLGSTVVALGNSLATTEKEVVEMGLRLAGAGKQVGMTEAQIMALGGSLSSVGIEAQAGGTAFSKLMIEMKLATVKGGNAVKDFATVAGMSAQEFTALFGRDATGAIIKFIQGLASLEGTGMTAIEVLDKMGITEIRLRDAILRATGASNVFTNSIELGSKAWQKNNELQEKTAIFYKTTEKRLAILRNQIAATGREIGNTLTPSLMVAANRVADVTKAFSELSPELKTSIVNWGLAAAAIGPMILIFSKITSGAAGALKALRNLAIFLSANAAVFSGAAAALAFLVNADFSAKGIESLSERRGLGLNESGRSKELADLRAEQDALARAKAMEAYDKAAVSRQSGSVIRGTGKTPVTAGTQPQVTPEIQAILDTFKKSEEAMKKVGSQGKATKQVFDEMTVSLAKSLGISNEEAQKRIESSKKIGEQTGKEIEALKERQNLMEETRNIALELNQTFASEDAARSLEALRMQLDIGNIGLEQYREALTKIREQFAMFPGAVEQIDSAMTALDISIQASTRTLGSFVREAETALREKFIEVPDLISSAFAGAIAYGEDLGDSLRRLAQDIAYAVIKATLLKSIFGLFGFADGGVLSGGNIVPFARGGIVDRPTIFPMAHGMGLMGEAGPEAIMPLKRTPSGDLGVQADGGGGETHITMNISAVDSRSFVEMMRTNRASVENIVVENIMKNGAVRSAMRGLA
ncbi:MAG TPA: phage tail tape measure protein [Synergistaceae bacterium]|nr:phage tail tape measure protein [Synergistaceae bacterium]